MTISVLNWCNFVTDFNNNIMQNAVIPVHPLQSNSQPLKADSIEKLLQKAHGTLTGRRHFAMRIKLNFLKNRKISKAHSL